MKCSKTALRADGGARTGGLGCVGFGGLRKKKQQKQQKQQKQTHLLVGRYERSNP